MLYNVYHFNMSDFKKFIDYSLETYNVHISAKPFHRQLVEVICFDGELLDSNSFKNFKLFKSDIIFLKLATEYAKKINSEDAKNIFNIQSIKKAIIRDYPDEIQKNDFPEEVKILLGEKQ